jgi:hypothetical protein
MINEGQLTTIRDIVEHIDSLSNDLIIYSKGNDWQPSSVAIMLPLPMYDPPPKAPEGMNYFLELDLAKEVLEVWRNWREGRMPSLEEACEAVIYYAEYDAYIE